ncbi:hypothetical protein LguiB_016894 [Lonicera macranthoides]
MVQKRIYGSGKVQKHFCTQKIAFWNGAKALLQLRGKSAKVVLQLGEKYVSLSNLVSLFILVSITLLIVSLFT